MCGQTRVSMGLRHVRVCEVLPRGDVANEPGEGQIGAGGIKLSSTERKAAVRRKTPHSERVDTSHRCCLIAHHVSCTWGKLVNEGVPAPAELRARGTTAVPAGRTDRDLQGGSGVETRHGRRGGRHGEGQALDRRPREVARAHAGGGRAADRRGHACDRREQGQ